MNCWDSINVAEQLGFYRRILLSCLFGLMSFIILYLPFSLIHSDIIVKDHGVIPVMIGFAILPLLHKILRILPIICVNKQMKLIWTLEKNVFPNFHVYNLRHTSKKMIFIALSMPTLLITIPCIIGGYFIPGEYPYFLLFGATNLSLSYIDFLSLRRLWSAPKKCVIVNDNQNYDILIQR